MAIIGLAPNPDRTILRNNNSSANGSDPDKALKANGFAIGGDILWDSEGMGNCLDEPQGDNLAKVGAVGALPGCK